MKFKILLVLIFFLVCCQYNMSSPPPVAFYGYFFFGTTVDGTDFTIWVKNMSDNIVYDVTATMLILKDDMVWGGFTLDYDLIPPGEIEHVSSKRFRNIVFTDSIRLKGVLDWDKEE